VPCPAVGDSPPGDTPPCPPRRLASRRDTPAEAGNPVQGALPAPPGDLLLPPASDNYLRQRAAWTTISSSYITVVFL
jgi:hypothetical protein